MSKTTVQGLAKRLTDVRQTWLRWAWLGGGIGLILLLTLACWGGNLPMTSLRGSETPQPTVVTLVVQASTLTYTPRPDTATTTPTPTNTTAPSSTVALSPTSEGLPTLITDDYGVPMALVPTGSFEMGSNADDALAECQKYRSDCERSWFEDEEPVHTVTLGDFYIDQYEVTNARYAACVDAGVCDPPSEIGSFTRDNYYGNSEYDNYPVIYVDWNDAQTYCQWRGARLPTEAEWEKAARGGLEGALYPWGDDAPVCEKGASNGAKFDDEGICYDTDTEPVGSYGSNGYELYDMAGNVTEWVFDWNDVYPGGDPNASGSFGETRRVLRGGGWRSYGAYLRVANRPNDYPYFTSNFIGFRCACDASQSEMPWPEPTAQATQAPSHTDTPTPTPTITPSPTEGLLTLITDEFGVPMALVPAGAFEMGYEDGKGDEKPIHTITLDDFYIDRYEVTNARYAECVDAGVCDLPSSTKSETRDSYYGNREYDDYPVIYVDWDDAQTYCQWRGARLPTEAEWEKAARGGLEGAQYPWGNTFDGTLANFCDVRCSYEWKDENFDDGYADTAPVGMYPRNGYALYDMAGNVNEWTAGWYDVYPGGDPNTNNYFGGTLHVVRGGSWYSFEDCLRVTDRGHSNSYYGYNVLGFRCARAATP